MIATLRLPCSEQHVGSHAAMVGGVFLRRAEAKAALAREIERQASVGLCDLDLMVHVVELALKS